MVLFVDACVREGSRTRRLAEHLIKTLNVQYDHLYLGDCSFPKTDAGFIEKRDSLLREGALSDPMFDHARQFAEAEEVIIAAPFWDLSFPAILKTYLEQINVVGITFRYNENGQPEGLCRAKRLYYVTTAGGTFLPAEYGFGYVEALAKSFYGIGEVELIKATGLDIAGAPVEQILKEGEEEISRRFRSGS